LREKKKIEKRNSWLIANIILCAPAGEIKWIFKWEYEETKKKRERKNSLRLSEWSDL